MQHRIMRTLCLAGAAAVLVSLAGCGGSGDSNSTTTTTAAPAVFYAHNAVFSNHTTWAWGANESGQLGNGGTTASNVPVRVVGFANFSGVAIGASHTLAFQKYSTVRAWGYNGFGQLGNGVITNSSRPVKAGTTLSGVVAVAAGGYHSLALDRNGGVWAWGSNALGQLGSSITAVGLLNSLPVQVPSDQINGVFLDGVAIAAGGSHSLAIKASDGTVWAWGNNNYGQLGSSRSDWSEPKPVSGITGTVVKIAGGGSHSLALTSDGTIWAWGYNYFGQLGNGTTTNSTTPVAVTIPGLNGTALIAAGLDHSMAYDPLTDTLWVWGYNTYGQLGDGSTTNRTVPKAIPFFSLNVGGGTLPQIFAVGHHSHARKTNGKWFSWGSNSSGQLGNGTIVDSRVPVPVSGL